MAIGRNCGIIGIQPRWHMVDCYKDTMSKIENCGNCRYMIAVRKNGIQAECHHNAPAKHAPSGTGWPFVTPTEWCGGYAPMLPKDKLRTKGTLTTG